MKIIVELNNDEESITLVTKDYLSEILSFEEIEDLVEKLSVAKTLIEQVNQKKFIVETFKEKLNVLNNLNLNQGKKKIIDS